MLLGWDGGRGGRVDRRSDTRGNLQEAFQVNINSEGIRGLKKKKNDIVLDVVEKQQASCVEQMNACVPDYKYIYFYIYICVCVCIPDHFT